jgi:hypothetical protein
MPKGVVCREDYVVVITGNAGVNEMECGGKYAGRRSITTQARCGRDRLLGLPSSTSVQAVYFIDLAVYLVE